MNAWSRYVTHLTKTRPILLKLGKTKAIQDVENEEELSLQQLIQKVSGIG